MVWLGLVGGNLDFLAEEGLTKLKIHVSKLILQAYFRIIQNNWFFFLPYNLFSIQSSQNLFTIEINQKLSLLMHVPRIWNKWCILYDMIENAEDIFPHYFQIRYSKHWDFYLVLQKILQVQGNSDAHFH